MSAGVDQYPSRIEVAGQIIPREDPVVYGEDTAAAGPLSASELSTYREKGYLFIDSFLDRDAVGKLTEEVERLRVSEEVRQSELAVREPASGAIRSIFAVPSVSEQFSELARDPRILGSVEQILGSAVYLHQSKLNLRPGFRGKEFYWHSDFETWHAEDGMRHMRAVNCLVLLTDSRELNSPMMVIPGSHLHFCQCSGLTPENHYQQSLMQQDYGIPSDEQLEWLTEQGGIEAPMGPAGSLILFDSNLMHGSNGNITPYPGTNASIVYNSVENVLEEPFAAEHERPWFLANREPEALQAV